MNEIKLLDIVEIFNEWIDEREKYIFDEEEEKEIFSKIVDRVVIGKINEIIQVLNKKIV